MVDLTSHAGSKEQEVRILVGAVVPSNVVFAIFTT
jgi:hypothetical protein